jgi:hypothetical protein
MPNYLQKSITALSIRVAFHTPAWNIEYVVFSMLVDCLLLVVTDPASPIGRPIGVTLGAVTIGSIMVNGEGMIEACRCPAVRIVAHGALRYHVPLSGHIT